MTWSTARQTEVPRWQRPLLPGDLFARTGGRRSARDWVVDAIVVVAALVFGAFGLSAIRDDHGDLGLVLDAVLGSIACLALWWRRSRPHAVAFVAVPLSAVAGMAGGAGLLAVFNVAVRGSVRALAALIVLSLAAFATFPLLYPSVGSWASQVLFSIVVLVVAVSWGLFARVRRELVLSLRDRADQLEREQRRQAEQARDAERRRIAREMHDVLAHRLSLLSVHAGALEFRPDASPEEVAEAAGVIRSAAQSALEELRQVIGVLREDSDDSGPEPPQPTLAQVPALVEESRAAGMRVRSRIEEPEDGPVPVALGRTAYRVVQEGLTNARKHAPGAAVDVSVSAGDGRLVVEVVSRRAVGATASPAGGEGESRLPGAGTGLVGLAERVEIAGGELHSGTDANGDFVLRATLPLMT
jgi:signal transduction histidine kinase